MDSLVLSLDDFTEDAFELIIINSNVEDYKLAYLINQKLNVHLKKVSPSIDLQINDQKVYFSLYQSLNCLENTDWFLIKNKTQYLEQNTINEGLFESVDLEEQRVENAFLLKQFKKNDYLLKLDASYEEKDLSKIISELNTIEVIQTAFPVDTASIRKKEYLIF